LETIVNAVSNAEIDLSWTDYATNAVSYEVDRTTDGQTWTMLTNTLAADANSYVDTSNFADGTMYGYRVRAVNAAGGSGYATNAAATLPGAPQNLNAWQRPGPVCHRGVYQCAQACFGHIQL
jgi:titin